VRDLFGPRSRSSPTRCGWVLRAATLLTGLHLRHGIASGFQSIGFDHPSPAARWRRNGTVTSSSRSWSTRPTAAATRSSSWAPAWPAPRRRPRSASWATTSSASASRTARGGRTASRRRAASTPPRTTRTTATASTGCSTTRSRAGDYRAREANVYRLAQLSVNIIDQCVAQGVPFAREYGGLLDNRSFGGAQVSRTFYARGPDRPAAAARRLPVDDAAGGEGHGHAFAQREMLDLVVVNGQARGIIVRNLVTGELERYAGHAVLLCTGGYGTAYYLSTNAVNSNVTAAWRATSAARTSPTPASRRFTRPASRCRAITSRS
jgi:hypothetical protein